MKWPISWSDVKDHIDDIEDGINPEWLPEGGFGYVETDAEGNETIHKIDPKFLPEGSGSGGGSDSSSNGGGIYVVDLIDTEYEHFFYHSVDVPGEDGHTATFAGYTLSKDLLDSIGTAISQGKTPVIRFFNNSLEIVYASVTSWRDGYWTLSLTEIKHDSDDYPAYMVEYTVVLTYDRTFVYTRRMSLTDYT